MTLACVIIFSCSSTDIDDLPLEAACTVMTLCCFILAIPFATALQHRASLPQPTLLKRRAINREEQINGSHFQVVLSGGRGVSGVGVGVKMIEGQARA